MDSKINLKDDDIYSLFIRIAIPSSIGTIFQNLYSIVDSIFAGQMISDLALAAIGQIFPIYFVIIALGVGLSIGTTSLIANSIGENNLENSGKVFKCLFEGLGEFVKGYCECLDEGFKKCGEPSLKFAWDEMVGGYCKCIGEVPKTPKPQNIENLPKKLHPSLL